MPGRPHYNIGYRKELLSRFTAGSLLGETFIHANHVTYIVCTEMHATAGPPLALRVHSAVTRPVTDAVVTRAIYVT